MRMCLITGIFPPDVGGPATYVNNLARALHHQQHQVCVITLGDAELASPFPVKRISRTYPLPVRVVVIFAVLLRRGWQSEVWYVNGLELPAVLAGKILRKRLVMKVVSDYAWERAGNQGLTTDTVQEFQTKTQPWKVELHKKLRAWLTRQVEMVITPSQHVKRLVCGWGNVAERVQVIYNAVEPIAEDDLGTKTATRQRLGLPVDAYVLITIGRLIPLKGVDALIRAIAWFRNAPEETKEYVLLIVGDGAEKNRLTELARTLHVSDLVYFLGQRDRASALAYLRASDLFVLNSSTEGFSHVILEAMMTGTPVIATNVGGNPELVTHHENGILIPHGDFEALTAQIRTVARDQTLQARFSEAGRLTVQQFAWERLLQQTLDVLQGA